MKINIMRYTIMAWHLAENGCGALQPIMKAINESTMKMAAAEETGS
jgi:hypothetical protein